MSFDNLIGYILSISMCMLNFITIFFTVQETWPFSLFLNLELGKASTKKNVSSQSLGLDLVNINVYAKVYQNIPLCLRDRSSFTFSEFEPRQLLSQSQMTFDNLLGYILSISMAYAKFYQNTPNGLRVIDIFHERPGDKIFTNRPVTKSSQTGR